LTGWIHKAFSKSGKLRTLPSTPSSCGKDKCFDNRGQQNLQGLMLQISVYGVEGWKAS
jgi:hypothetical protein